MISSLNSDGATSDPTVLAMGSGYGGAGRTTLTLEMMRAFGRRGLRTLIVDCADVEPVSLGPLGLEHSRPDSYPDGQLSDNLHLVDFIIEQPRRSLALLPLAWMTGQAEGPDAASPDISALIKRLRRLDFDIIVLDLPVSTIDCWIDAFILSDLPLVVTSADAWAVGRTVAFLRRAAARAVQKHGRSLTRSYVLVNGCRDNAERDLGEVLCHAIWRNIGHYPRYLGPVDFDDRRWFHLRHTDVFPSLSANHNIGRQIEHLAKRILSLHEFNESRPRDDVDEPHTDGVAWLGLSETTSPPDLRAQYRRLWEGYRRDSAVSQVLVNTEERKRLIGELERTYRALQVALDQGRPLTTGRLRAVTDKAETAPARSRDPSSTESAPIPAAPVPPKVESVPIEPANPNGQSAEITDVAEIPARNCAIYLRRVRDSRGLSMRELALRTRIAVRHLQSIESMALDALPAPVYLRGYLREIARVLDLPPETLLERYLEEMASRQN